ncbi:AAA family ATPase [Patulibacter defluvii]|uniref:AAA family ATPase n=1 Tax=Patulibacter defluvii TaxID=3095358 RepID=UPI002A75BE68|nr:hypothetical protein [Patulibacter sp. DM4]
MFAGNPFRYDAPTPPERLIDRREEQQQLSRAAASRTAVRLSAPRRYGKTSLLHAHCAALRSAGHRAVLVDLSSVGDREAVLGRVAAAYAGLGRPAGQAVRGLLMRFGLTVGVPGLATAQVAPAGARGPAAVPDAALVELLDLPRRLYAEDGILSVVCFDEFQDLLGAGRGLDGLLRSVIQHHGDAAAYVYAGSAPSLMRALFDDRERPLFGQARPLELGPLPLDEALADGDRLMEEIGYGSLEALATLVAIADGHPQRTVLLAHHLVELLEQGADRDEASLPDAVVEIAFREVRDALEATWAGLPGAERHVLRAIARGLPPTGQAAAAESGTPATTLASALRRLVDDGQHVVAAGSGWRLIDPLLGLWIRRATT